MRSERRHLQSCRVKPTQRRMRVIVALTTILAVTQALPSDFSEHAKEVILSKSTEPHLGVWNDSDRDWAALAAMLIRDVRYLQEVISARQPRNHRGRWEGDKDSLFLALGREREALEAVEKAGALTAEEVARLAQLKASKLDGENPPAVTAESVVAEYSNNEARGDEHYKGKVVALTGKAFGIVKSPFGNTYVQMVSEIPTRGLHCQMNDAFVSAAAGNRQGPANPRARPRFGAHHWECARDRLRALSRPGPVDKKSPPFGPEKKNADRTPPTKRISRGARGTHPDGSPRYLGRVLYADGTKSKRFAVPMGFNELQARAVGSECAGARGYQSQGVRSEGRPREGTRRPRERAAPR